jgi:pyruvate-formate lyase-activating enzyme
MSVSSPLKSIIMSFAYKRRSAKMSADNIEELYERHIKPLLPEERLRLLAKVAQGLAEDAAPHPKRSLLELEGLGAEMWGGVEGQEYVNQLRGE